MIMTVITDNLETLADQVRRARDTGWKISKLNSLIEDGEVRFEVQLKKEVTSETITVSDELRQARRLLLHIDQSAPIFVTSQSSVGFALVHAITEVRAFLNETLNEVNS